VKPGVHELEEKAGITLRSLAKAGNTEKIKGKYRRALLKSG